MMLLKGISIGKHNMFHRSRVCLLFFTNISLPRLSFYQSRPYNSSKTASIFSSSGKGLRSILSTLTFGQLGNYTALNGSLSFISSLKEHIEKNSVDWFSKSGLQNDFRSKQLLFTLHIWMIHRRLIAISKEADDSAKKKAMLSLQECLFDEFWDDTTNRIQAAGIPILSVNKNLQDVQKYSFRLCLELDEALANAAKEQPEEGQDREDIIVDEFGGVLWRMLYNRSETIQPEKVVAIARYIREEQLSLNTVSVEAMAEGRVAWGNLPVWPGKTEKTRDNLPSTPVEVLEEWREAIAADGRTYYWYFWNIAE